MTQLVFQYSICNCANVICNQYSVSKQCNQYLVEDCIVDHLSSKVMRNITIKLHISMTNCTEITGDRSGQLAYMIFFSTEGRFSLSEFCTPRFK